MKVGGRFSKSGAGWGSFFGYFFQRWGVEATIIWQNRRVEKPHLWQKSVENLPQGQVLGQVLGQVSEVRINNSVII
jgi:hypothetical protein